MLRISFKNLSKTRDVRQYKRAHKRFSFLQNCPHKLAVCRKLFIAAPKKPNSANRKVAKIYLPSIKRNLFAYVPGQCPHGLNPYSQALIRGGRVRDLPGIRYKLIRGTFDFKGVPDRKTSRSKYGVKKNK